LFISGTFGSGSYQGTAIQAVVSSFASESAASAGSPAGAFATTTMAGRNSRPFRVQACVQA
jgi:hypothetical protein